VEAVEGVGYKMEKESSTGFEVEITSHPKEDFRKRHGSENVAYEGNKFGQVLFRYE
jgi:hypothetical protein